MRCITVEKIANNLLTDARWSRGSGDRATVKGADEKSSALREDFGECYIMYKRGERKREKEREREREREN